MSFTESCVCFSILQFILVQHVFIKLSTIIFLKLTLSSSKIAVLRSSVLHYFHVFIVLKHWLLAMNWPIWGQWLSDDLNACCFRHSIFNGNSFKVLECLRDYIVLFILNPIYLYVYIMYTHIYMLYMHILYANAIYVYFIYLCYIFFWNLIYTFVILFMR